MEIKGKLVRLLDVVTRKDFSSRKAHVLVPDEKYPQTIEVEVSGKNLELFDRVAPGTDVVCHCNLRGNEWVNPDKAKNPNGTPSVFNTIQCWKVDAEKNPVPLAAAETKLPEINDDLPF